MYSNPSDIRTNEIKIRLNDTELELVEAYAEYTHTQKAAIAREILMLGLKAIAAGQDLSQHNAVNQ